MLSGVVAGDWPEAEVVNNVTEVSANTIESLMYATGIDMVEREARSSISVSRRFA